MSNINNTEKVKQQFLNDKDLEFRIKFYSKYCKNKQTFTYWLFNKYIFNEYDCILELGCGNGNQWDGRIEQLPKGCKLLLSDFSDGMVEAVKRRYAKYSEKVSFKKIDIQSIPFKDESFDVVIANHMLFHIPDLNKALLEVVRVLKSGGRFYAATDGSGGMRPFLHNAIKQIDPDTDLYSDTISINLQNGKDILSKYFISVERFDYNDGLVVTKTQDLMNWFKSTTPITGYSEDDLKGLYDYFERIRMTEGVIYIPKENGLLIGVKGRMKEV